MDSTHDDRTAATAAPVSDDVLARALRRLGRRAGAALGGVSLLGATPLAGCLGDDLSIHEIEAESWATDEGQRNTDMVLFTGDSWSSCRYPNTRFGCGALDVFVKLRVRPVAGVDLAWKRVGVVYRSIGSSGAEQTAVGYYHATGADGLEEWHVPITVYANAATLVFDAWYQDGGGRTFVDDNQGERHIVNTGYPYSIVRVEPWNGTVVIDDDGVRGRVTVQVADLDYDKRLTLVGTLDDWQTIIELPIGNAGEANRWVWVEKFPWSSHERWQIDLDLLATGVQRFQYAVAYRHGVVNGARGYEFWDNNGHHNYTVERAAAE